MDHASLQERYAPTSTCFGCGPANPIGLHIRSRLAGPPDEAAGQDGAALIAEWQPRPEHEAFVGTLNGGIIGTLLDCHSNWTAAMHLMAAAGAGRPPATVTAELAIRYLRPTPTDRPVTMRARVVESGPRRAIVEGSLASGDAVCATSRATFVAVGPDHPADGRW